MDAETGRRCGLLDWHPLPHRSGRGAFTQVAVGDHFPRKDELALRATSNPVSIP